MPTRLRLIPLCATIAALLCGSCGDDATSIAGGEGRGVAADVGATAEPDADGTGDGVEAPAKADPIAAIIETAIIDLVSGKVSIEQDWGRIQNALLEAAVDEDLGDERVLRVSARAITELIIEQGMNGPAGESGEVDAARRAAAASLAETLAVSFRESVKVGGVHRGILARTPAFDVPEGRIKTTWKMLSGFSYSDGMKLPAAVAALDEKHVGMAGFMMSMGEYENVRNFLLVESQWSCCFGQPPDINQIVICQVPLDVPPTDMTSVPVRVLGTLEVGEDREDGYVISLYRMVVERVDALE